MLWVVTGNNSWGQNRFWFILQRNFTDLNIVAFVLPGCKKAVLSLSVPVYRDQWHLQWRAVCFLQSWAIEGPDTGSICLCWWLNWVFSGIFLVKYASNHNKIVLLQRRKAKVIKTLQELWGDISDFVPPPYDLQCFPKMGRRHHLHLCSAQDWALYLCYATFLQGLK